MTTVTDSPSTTLENVESFRARARSWISENLKPIDGQGDAVGYISEAEELAELQRQRGIQRMLFDAGFAGIIVPKQYGGAGLTPAHAQAFGEEISGYDFPTMLQVPNVSPCMAVILEFGTEDQKLLHVPAILKGEEVFVQFLSEPGGGSDVAGATTTAVRDGDEWVINGSKIWSSSAWRNDWGLCLARTNWDVEKHRGLTVFMVPIRSPGLEVHRIEMANGGGPGHFCQEFFTDVRIPDANRVGGIDDGWSVGVRWMYYERTNSVSPLVIHAETRAAGYGTGQDELVRLGRKSGRISDPLIRNKIGELRASQIVTPETTKRILQGMRTGYLSDQSAALIRLMSGVNRTDRATVAFELAGGAGFAWSESDVALGKQGMDFLTRQAAHIGGGTIEMARNVISERVLLMPRERAGDKDIAYKDVPKGPPNT